MPLCGWRYICQCKSQPKLKELECVEQLFVQPQMNGGLCLKGQQRLQNEHGIEIKKLENMYLGPFIEEKALPAFIESKRFPQRLNDNE